MILTIILGSLLLLLWWAVWWAYHDIDPEE